MVKVLRFDYTDPYHEYWIVEALHPYVEYGHEVPLYEHEIWAGSQLTVFWPGYQAVGFYWDETDARAAMARYLRYPWMLLSRCSGCHPGTNRWCPF